MNNDKDQVQTMNNHNEKNRIKKSNSVKDSILLGAIKGLTVPISYLKAFPRYINKDRKLEHYPMNQSVVIKHDENEIVIRRNGFEKELVVDFNGFQTITSLFKDCVEKFSEKHLFGTRKLIKKDDSLKDSNGKTITKLTLGDFEWESYKEVWMKIQSYISFLKYIKIDFLQKVAIWSDTCADWMCLCLALMFMKINVVTVYSTLVDDAIIYALNLTKVTSVCVDYKAAQRLFKILPKLPYLSNIFYFSSCDDEILKQIPQNVKKFNIISVTKKRLSIPKISKSLSKSFKISKSLKKTPLFTSLDGDCIPSNTNIRNSVINGTNNILDENDKKNVQNNDNLSEKDVKDLNDKVFETCKLSDKENFNNTEVQLDENELESNKNINCSNNFNVSQQESIKDENQTLNSYHISEMLTKGFEYLNKNNLELENVLPDDIALIMFTSGSTGMPKGVVIQHKSIVATMASGCQDKRYWYDLVYAAYLPLAHIFEFLNELAMAANGAAIGYCHPLTLTDTSPMIAPGTKGDFTCLKPTVGAFVPLLLERIKKGVLEKVKERGPFASSVLEYSIYHSKNMRHISSDAPAIEKLAFNKVRSLIGGNFRWAVCGGAPLCPLTQEFANITFGFPVVQGYGLTETCAGGTLGNFYDFSIDNTGPPLSCVEIKLIPWKEGGYFPNDKPNPRGEIIIGGINVASGYYENQELTDEVFYIDQETKIRWFKTGDIGEYCQNGTIKIIDRKKDIIKLKNGEYVSLVFVETAIIQSRFVELICVMPNSQSDYLIAFIMPNMITIKSELSNITSKVNIDSSHEEIVNNEQVIEEIKNDVLQICKDSSLTKFAIPQKIVIVSDIWTPDNGLLTPSMKIKRVEMKKFYQNFF